MLPLVVCTFPYRQVIADVVSNVVSTLRDRECVIKLNIFRNMDLTPLQSASSRSLRRSPPLPLNLKNGTCMITVAKTEPADGDRGRSRLGTLSVRVSLVDSERSLIDSPRNHRGRSSVSGCVTHALQP
jgi:hypothetical protein